jgi:O-antigen ligase
MFAFRFIGERSRARAEFTETRMQSVTNLGADYSLMMRVNSYMTVIGKIEEHPWIGNGLGDTATYLFFGQYSTQNNVDSTYLTILWKMGSLGLLAFLLLYTILLFRAFRIYRATGGILTTVFAVAVLSAFSAYLVLGTISPVLITYRFNFLFGTLFALVEIIFRREKDTGTRWTLLELS